MKDFVVWAQALDNTSPDRMFSDAEEISATDTLRRQQAVAKVSRVCESGTRVHDSKKARLTVFKRRFVLEISPDDRDVAGRIAPIVFYAKFRPMTDQNLAQKVLPHLTDCAARIGRELTPSVEDAVRQAFESLKKNLKTRALLIRILLATAIVAISILLLVRNS